jgi:hypothetical protein
MSNCEPNGQLLFLHNRSYNENDLLPFSREKQVVISSLMAPES